MANISVDIDIDDIIWGMSTREKQELVDELYDDGIKAKNDKRVVETDFDKSVEKLIGNSWRLSSEDEKTILEISSKIID